MLRLKFRAQHLERLLHFRHLFWLNLLLGNTSLGHIKGRLNAFKIDGAGGLGSLFI